MKRMLLMTTSILVMVGLASSQPLLDLKITLANDVGGQQELHFGLDGTATNGLDVALGENELPPFPPTDVFEARFIGDDIEMSELGQGSYFDYRAGDSNFSGTVEHEIKYQASTSGSQIKISWDFPEGVSATLQDFFGGTVVNEAMSDSGIYVLTNLGIDKLKLTVNYDGFVTSVNSAEGIVPSEFQLFQNYPNPFNPSTQISYSLSKDSRVQVSVYNLLGQEVVQLVDEYQKAGQHSVMFTPTDLTSGVYVYKIRAGVFTESRKLMLIK